MVRHTTQGAARIVVEIKAVLAEHMAAVRGGVVLEGSDDDGDSPGLETITLVGNSLGGLYARHVAASLYDPATRRMLDLKVLQES